MKNQLLTLISILVLGHLATAANLDKKMGDLGGNKDLIRKAKYLDPDNKVRIVQKRTVERHWRLELGMNYGMVAGGDPYVSTQSLGGNLDLHINPRWSVGARYYNHYNELTSEGERVFKDVGASNSAGIPYTHPAIDYPLNTTLGVVSFYPVYGKLNLFDMGVAQFDLYVLGGYGETKLESGSSPTWTAGGGVGLWMSQHFASRLEVRYQNYQDKIYTGARELDLVMTSFSIGFLL